MESESIQTLAFKLLKPTTKHPTRKIGGRFCASLWRVMVEGFEEYV